MLTLKMCLGKMTNNVSWFWTFFFQLNKAIASGNLPRLSKFCFEMTCFTCVVDVALFANKIDSIWHAVKPVLTTLPLNNDHLSTTFSSNLTHPILLHQVTSDLKKWQFTMSQVGKLYKIHPRNWRLNC